MQILQQGTELLCEQMVRHKLEPSDWELDENQAGSYEEMKIVIFHH